MANRQFRFFGSRLGLSFKRDMPFNDIFYAYQYVFNSLQIWVPPYLRCRQDTVSYTLSVNTGGEKSIFMVLVHQ